MPIMMSTVLCGSHSGDLVPDLHGLVPESGDIEILATHVSYCDGQPDPHMIHSDLTGEGQNTLPRTAEHQSIRNNVQHQLIPGMHAQG